MITSLYCHRLFISGLYVGRTPASFFNTNKENPFSEEEQTMICKDYFFAVVDSKNGTGLWVESHAVCEITELTFEHPKSLHDYETKLTFTKTDRPGYLGKKLSFQVYVKSSGDRHHGFGLWESERDGGLVEMVLNTNSERSFYKEETRKVLLQYLTEEEIDAVINKKELLLLAEKAAQ
jgi:hypothetical protein